MRLLHVGEIDSTRGSRLGGAPPEGLDITCPVCGGPAEYVLTLGPDVLGPTVDDRALSLLACADLGCRFEGPHGACSTLVVAHVDTPRSAAGVGSVPVASADGGWEGRALTVGPDEDDPDPNSDQSKVGGGPGYLQSWGYEAGPELEAAGLAFLAQWSEVSYRRDMDGGTYPFMFGTAYLFAARTDAGAVDLATARGFWQNA